MRRQIACRWRMCWLLLAGAALPAGVTVAAAAVPPTAMHHYVLLERARVQYQELARHAELTRLPPLPARSLRIGDAYAGLAGLRTLLAACVRPCARGAG
jgi:hypothetical protein